MRFSGRLAGFTCALLLATPSLAAPGISNIDVDGNTATADIAVGSFGATLTIRFENVVGLTAQNLGLSAKVVDPLSPTFVTRLGNGVSLPVALPLVVKIAPPETGGLSFSGVVSVELYTHDLQFTVGSPLRLYSAPDGGSFQDVTTFVSAGSVRSGGSKGSFSEFIIAADVRPLATAISDKFAKLGAQLNQYAPLMTGTAAADLVSLYNASANAYSGGNLIAAIEYLEAFDDRVRTGSGRQIPDVWRSSGDLTNVAGLLRSAAATLRYSLNLATNA